MTSNHFSYHFNVNLDFQVRRICILHVPILFESTLVVIGNRSTVYKRTLETPHEPKLLRNFHFEMKDPHVTFFADSACVVVPTCHIVPGGKAAHKEKFKNNFLSYYSRSERNRFMQRTKNCNPLWSIVR